MRYLTEKKDLIGKVVKRVIEIEDCLCFEFTDGTAYIIEQGLEDPGWWALKHPSLEFERQAGYITDEEYIAACKRAEHAREENHRALELKELERLKKKYPLHGNTPQPCLVDPRK